MNRFQRMAAIRCKSNSQVSSQVMIPIGLLLIFLVVGPSTEIKVFQQLEKNEYCVKLIATCEKLRDKVENFREVGFEETTSDTALKKSMSDTALTKYIKLGCFPKDLSQDDLQSYGYLVAKWEKEIQALFLYENLFAVVVQHKGGQKIKVTFGAMQGWCPLSDEYTTSTTIRTTSGEESSEETYTINSELTTTTKKSNEGVPDRNTPDSCKISGDIDRWVNNEISGTQNMSGLTNRLPDFEKLIGEYSNHTCCPYKSIRDRVEIINDGIDILEDLQDLKPSEKKDYKDIESDFRNLNRRLDQLRTGNDISSYTKCCPDFSDQLKSFQNTFQSNLQDFNPPKSNLNLKDLLRNATALEDTCSQQQNQLSKALQTKNNNRNNNNPDKACCGDEAKKIKEMENSLKDLQAPNSQQDLSENLNSVKENLAKTNKTLADAENLMSSVAKQIEEMKNECGKQSRIQASKKLIDGLISNVNKLVNKLNDMELIRTVDLSKQKTPLGSFRNIEKTLEGVNNNFKPNNAEKHQQEIENLKDKFKKVNRKYEKFHDNYELDQETAKKIIKKYQKQYDDLQESIKAMEASRQRSLSKESVKAMEPSPQRSSPSKDGENLKPDIDKLEKDLVNLLDNDIPKLAQDIKDYKKNFAGEGIRKEHQEAIDLYKAEINRKKKLLFDRIDKMNNNEKGRQSELLSDRLASLKKKIADRHEVHNQNVNEMNRRVIAALQAAGSCQDECNLDDFPTQDALEERVKQIENHAQVYIKKKKG